MDDIHLYKSTELARRLLHDGVSLVDGSKIAGHHYKTDWRKTMAYAMRAVEACRAARASMRRSLEDDDL